MFLSASTTLPVIGVPIKGSAFDGMDAMLSIIQMPPGIPVATVGVNGAMNAAILAVEIMALADASLAEKMKNYKDGLGAKIEKANKDLASEIRANLPVATGTDCDRYGANSVNCLLEATGMAQKGNGTAPAHSVERLQISLVGDKTHNIFGQVWPQ